MIRPVQFRMNEQTAVNNYYQKTLEQLTPENVADKAVKEFDGFVQKLKAKGVNVIVVQDTKEPDTPDSIFPNNWISFHADGRVALYPMFAENRRQERRTDILEKLKSEHGLNHTNITDYSGLEKENRFLEGTGSMVLDRENKICYAALSIRTERKAAEKFCKDFGYKLCAFTSNQTVNGERKPIYHTNVMMCVADKYAVVCLDTIDDISERTELIDTLEQSDKEVIEISEEQKERFAGNMLQVANDAGVPLLVMSTSAYESLTDEQIERLNAHNEIIHSDINTIEICGGGSARCMMAEVFLPKN